MCVPLTIAHAHIQNEVMSAIFSLLCHEEVLADPAISARLADAKAISEMKALDAFYQMLQSEPARAFYG